METENDVRRILSGFGEVFRFLSSKKCSVPDDAILHIFIDVLEESLAQADHGSIISSGLVNFLEITGKTKEFHDSPVTIVVGLKLCSFLGRTSEKFVEWSNIIAQFMKTVWTQVFAPECQDVSMITALYSCLCIICSHGSGLKWILTEHEDCIRQCFVLLGTGSSVFLVKAIIDFLASLVHCPESFNCEKKLQDTHKYVWSTTRQKLHHYITRESDLLTPSARAPVIIAYLKLTEALIKPKGVMFDTLIEDEEFLVDFMKVLHMSHNKEMEICLNIVEQLVEEPRIQSRIIEVVDHLWKEGEPLKSLKLLNRIFHSLKTTDQSFSKLRVILTAPLFLVCDDDRATFRTDVLKSKSSLTNLLCTSLSGLTKAKLKETGYILQLFRTTVESEDQSEFSVFLLNNRKIQRSCLQYFHENKDMLNELDAVLGLETAIRIMEQLNVDSVTYSLCTKCVQGSLPLLIQSAQRDSLGQDLARIIQRHLCSLQWELRDTTVEFLGNVAVAYGDKDCVVSWIQANSLHAHIFQCVQDGESYVRASAISSLWHLYTSRQLWTSMLKSLSRTESTVLEKVISILDTDAEAFARRSAAEFLLKYTQNSPLSSSMLGPSCSLILHTFLKALNDFDWEVKLYALNFVNSFAQHQLALTSSDLSVDVPEYAKDLLSDGNGSGHCDSDKGVILEDKIQGVYGLCSSGCFSHLFNVLDDYDEKVCEKACEVVSNCKKWLQDAFKGTNMTVENIENMFKSKEKTLVHDEAVDTDSCVHEAKRQKPNSYGSEQKKTLSKDFAVSVHSIMNFDQVSYKARFDSKTDYHANPMSLVQDILSYASKDEDDNIVDCY